MLLGRFTGIGTVLVLARASLDLPAKALPAWSFCRSRALTTVIVRWQFHSSPKLINKLINTMTGMRPMLEAHACIDAVMIRPSAAKVPAMQQLMLTSVSLIINNNIEALVGDALHA